MTESQPPETIRNGKANTPSLFGFALLLIVVLGIAYFVAQSPWFLPVDVSHHTIEIDGVKREFRLVIPKIRRSLSNEIELQAQAKLKTSRKYPVVFALHGALDTTDEMAKYTELDQLCSERGFLLVYLQGRILNWHPSIPDDNPDVMTPDLRFFEGMCDLIEEKHSGDPDRIYVVGVSQGGGMTSVLAAKCSQRIAAAVCNCGWLPKPLGETSLDTVYKCPLLFISGTKDKQVAHSTTRHAHDVFKKNGHPVVFHSIEGAGHGWNGKHGVNQLIWEFLSKQQRTFQPKEN